MKIILSLWILLVGLAHTVQAETSIVVVTSTTKSVILAMRESKYEEFLQTTLNAIVKKSVGTLRDHGFNDEAAQFEQEWTAQFQYEFTGLTAMELGDHRPLSRWLANFYNQLEKKLGYRLCHFIGFDDIKIINFALPVALHPAGYLGDSWSMIEYRKHFVPLSGAIVYWSSQVACTVVLAGLASYACAESARVTRFLTVRFVTPSVSNYVYKKAQSSPALPSLTDPEYDLDAIFAQAQVQLD